VTHSGSSGCKPALIPTRQSRLDPQVQRQRTIQGNMAKPLCDA